MIEYVPTTVIDVLDEINQTGASDAARGSMFENLMVSFLRTDPTYASQFDSVWPWQEWPGRDGKHDTGIDIVARERATGDLVAVQCKFYARTSTVSKPDIDSFLAASGKEGFGRRIIISTTDRWNAHAEETLQGQQIPVSRLSLSDLEGSPIDWSRYSLAKPDELTRNEPNALRPHQQNAIKDVISGFAEHDRGQLIMACGTGKTFTSLRLAEQLVGKGGSVLFLVPSISLLSQSLREWTAQAEVPLVPLAVCSDRKATARSKATNEDISAVDLALPATTDVSVFEARLAQALTQAGAMTVVFATYQSIDVVARAQSQNTLPEFDLIICDEAHRTTGVTLAGSDESAFVRVHDATYLRAERRLYMTATPRLYNDAAKTKAGEADALLASMDDESTFGPEFHRLGFGEAVSNDLLTDYKVLVLAVDETAVAKTFQAQLSEDGELKLDDAAKIVGCWNGLAKRGLAEHSFSNDPEPMRRAVAFSGTIADSKKIEDLFTAVVGQYTHVHDLDDADEPALDCAVRHVDGSFNALERNAQLDWLKAPIPDGECRILTNARCLSEGVDVPALDAVMFLSPRKSVVDIVQSVGRVMRRDPAGRKKFGYIILPIGIPAGLTPEQALRDNKRYAAVWEVLQALRAHDERFNAMVNRLDLTASRDDKVNVIGVGGRFDGDADGSGKDTKGTSTGDVQLALNLATLDEWREALYAKIVAKVGSRRYWEDWAKDVADIAQRHITRITALLDDGDAAVSDEFEAFLEGLRGNLNANITQADAIDMLAQHLITRPVFDALFAGYDFSAHNPVAQSMERMLAALDEHSLTAENHMLERFYESVRMRVDGVDTAEGRQKLIVQLYDTFFRTAFPRTVDKLGIVYTPVEIVDFILRSADEVLREHFGQGLTDEGVHILDGFAGTGTFMVRLLQLGLISPHDLARKYANELHANEILLLAYYIAAVNIESTYHDAIRQVDPDAGYEPFPGLVLTDTFQSYEDGDHDDLAVFPENNDRINRQRKLPITVIVGNPPYSSGQDSANDNNANEKYPTLDGAIRDTYAERSTATNKNSLYDSYIRAIKWASLRIKNRGVIAYVTNGGWLDSNTADGMRLSLAEEFSDIYIYNLRGNQRTAGEQSRKEGGKVFDAGSRATVAITVLVKDPAITSAATIHYTDIGDYLSREQKLSTVAAVGSVASLENAEITPNASGDWLNQRSTDFGSFIALGDKTESPTLFDLYSGGLKTNRDAWVYSFSGSECERNVQRSLAFYNSEVDRFEHSDRSVPAKDFVDMDPRNISWGRANVADIARLKKYSLNSDGIRQALYRPFTREVVYFDRSWNDMVYQLPQLFPTTAHFNFGFVVIAPRIEAKPAVLAVSSLPDLSFFTYTGQFFARWRYEKVDTVEDALFGDDSGSGEIVDGYRKIDNITDEALALFAAVYDSTERRITKDDIFYYAYGLLHSVDYRATYAADLKKMLPRIPLVSDPWPFVEAGRALMQLHLGYEAVTPYPLRGLATEPPTGVRAQDFYRVSKMNFGKTRDPQTNKLISDRSTVIYNANLTLSGIPEAAYRYQLGSRSAIEWIMDRYQVRTDKASGIVNDPNDWSAEVGDPRYIVDLLARIVTVSLDTMAIVDALPALDIRTEA